MDLTCDKLLVILKNSSKKIIDEAVAQVPGLKIIEADSENRAFELICSHNFVLLILDDALDHIDIYSICAMLLSHQAVHDTPLLVITEDTLPDKLLEDFKTLHIDSFQKPFSKRMVQTRIKLFHDLFQHRKALDQSMNELELAYSKLVEQKNRIMSKELIVKKSDQATGMAAMQMQQALPGLKRIIQQLSSQKQIAPELQTDISKLKRLTSILSQTAEKLHGKKQITAGRETLSINQEKKYRLLYVQSSDEEFNIFKQCLKGSLSYKLSRAGTLEEAFAHMARSRVDLIIIDHLFKGGSGLELLSRLRQIKSDIPVIFAISRLHAREGHRAMARGALNFFLKEEITAGSLLSILDNTLEKSIIRRQADDAVGRIVMIAKKDMKTNLFTRRHFEKNLDEEMTRSKRYHTPLSILLIHFDALKHIRETGDAKTCDSLLSTCAALIHSTIRAGDTACSFEEDRFSIILPHTGMEGAGILARRIGRLISDYQFTKGSKTFKQTTSIGVAGFKPDEDTDSTLLTERALTALTAAMNKGPNAVELYE